MSNRENLVQKINIKSLIKDLIKSIKKKDSQQKEMMTEKLISIGKPAVEPLIKILNNKYREICNEITYILGKIGDSRAVEPLIQNLYNNRSASNAIFALGEIGDKKAVEPLIHTLNKGGNIEYNVRIALALGKIRDPRAVKPLVNALFTTNQMLRKRAFGALEEIGDPRAVNLLIQALKDENRNILGSRANNYELLQRHRNKFLYEIREQIIEDIVNIKCDNKVEALIQALKHENSGVRRGSTIALGKIGDTRAIEPLIHALKDESIRHNAALALDELNWEPLKETEMLYYFLAKRNWKNLVKLGKIAVEPLIQALKDKDKVVRKDAAETIGDIGDPRAIEPLIQALKDEDEMIRAWTAEALGKMGKPAVEPLIHALKDDHRWVRENAAVALGKIGDTRSVEPLIHALKDDHRWVREKAAGALGQIGNPRAVEPLFHTLKDKDSYVRKEAAEALKLLNWEPLKETEMVYYFLAKQNWEKLVKLGEIAVEPLIHALKEVAVRQNAAVALGEIGDTRAVNPLLKVVRDNSINMDSRVEIVYAVRHLSGDWPIIKLDRSNHRDNTIPAHGLCPGSHTDVGTKKYLEF